MGRKRPYYERPPRRTRHVWVVTERGAEPEQGFVVDWRRRNASWEALVVTVQADESTLQRWLPAVDLAPVTSRPTVPDAHDGF